MDVRAAGHREITAADYEYAIERAVLPGVANGYQSLYISDIVGYEEAVKAGQKDPTGGAPDMEGVTAIDDSTLEIQMDEPSAYTVEDHVARHLGSRPEVYAAEFDAENPSTYGESSCSRART